MPPPSLPPPPPSLITSLCSACSIGQPAVVIPPPGLSPRLVRQGAGRGGCGFHYQPQPSLVDQHEARGGRGHWTDWTDGAHCSPCRPTCRLLCERIARAVHRERLMCCRLRALSSKGGSLGLMLQRCSHLIVDQLKLIYIYNRRERERELELENFVLQGL